MRGKAQCESCLMPLDADSGPRESEKYCSYCFRNGKLTYEGTDVTEFTRLAYEGMRKQGMNIFKAWFFARMIRYAPRWRGR
ncbi:hypothetical protein HY969_04440 [Candidatus Kaiserbacteria bacterium]|nr:hypothetical protein [Candidatus Kaiserbacteria bacterium]